MPNDPYTLCFWIRQDMPGISRKHTPRLVIVFRCGVMSLSLGLCFACIVYRLEMLNFLLPQDRWKRILKKKTKTRPKTTKLNTEWKRSEKTKSVEVESQSPRSTKVNPGKVKVNPDKAEAEKAKKIQFKGLKLLLAYPVIHYPPQEMSVEILQARENLMKSIQTFLKKFIRISLEKRQSTISKTNSDEVIKSSVEDLVPILSESEGISDDTCHVPFYDNSPPLDVLNDHFELFSDFNNDCTSSDDDSFEDIDYIEASPPDSKLLSLEEVKDDILCEKLLNINLIIAKIESLNDNPTPDYVLKSPSLFPIPVEDSESFFEKFDTSLSYSNNSLPEFETFRDHMKETSSGITTTHADNSLPEYDSFLFKIEPNHGE
nr:hypothetical protein [Tanacetum cinerariifolium]